MRAPRSGGGRIAGESDALIKYLYLTRPEWADTWVNGGEIPIKPASTYLSDVRSGTNTPDETRIHSFPQHVDSFKPHIGIGWAKGMVLRGNIIDGVLQPDSVVDHYRDDGIILSFCNQASHEIMTKLGKTACVQIDPIEELKAGIDEQLGLKGLAGICRYTSDHRRDHFLKSVDDAWQSEYRLFWRLQREVVVKIPPGLAKVVTLTPR